MLLLKKKYKSMYIDVHSTLWRNKFYWWIKFKYQQPLCIMRMRELQHSHQKNLLENESHIFRSYKRQKIVSIMQTLGYARAKFICMSACTHTRERAHIRAIADAHRHAHARTDTYWSNHIILGECQMFPTSSFENVRLNKQCKTDFSLRIFAHQ